MEAYPPPYVEHNLPLVLLSGLGEHENDNQLLAQSKRQENGVRIVTESAECQSEVTEPLRQEFMNLDGRAHAWNAASLPGPISSICYHMRTIGRSYIFPARKAAPLPQSPGAEGSISPRNTELHSPLSPLSPGPGGVPNGLFTPIWFKKHQQQVPALFLAFFDLSVGDGASQDEQIKSDINAIRAALARSGFRTRFATILISDQSILHAPQLEDRLASIRRATSLDPKSGLFFMPPMSSKAEIATFVQSMFVALQPSCIEYYRDLTKHARRKKARGGPPPQVSASGAASHAIPVSGWNVRYEVKQGVFAEFRQEMDVAERHYSSAMEELFSLEGGIFETTASWNPRWDEARLLCDALAIRVLRCQLWHGQTTGAAQSWQNYKLRMRELVDRRGKGSNTYGWDAWEARMAAVMSELITRADIPSLHKSEKDAAADGSVQQAYCMPERTTDRLIPFNHLHHPGYWLRLLVQGIRARWEKALAIPEEDGIPPGQSPASLVANRSKNYDVYLVPEPHEEAVRNHAGEVVSASRAAVEEFEARRQMRMGEQIRLELAEDLVRVGRHADALQVLVQIWEQTTWRDDEWSTPFVRLLSLLSQCATQDKTKRNASLMLALTWEMSSVNSLDAQANVQNMTPNLTQCIDAWHLEERLTLRVYDKQRLSPIRPRFAFRERESHVGEPLECQVILEYQTTESAAPFLEASSLQFKIGSRMIRIQHQASGELPRQTDLLSMLTQTHGVDNGSLEFIADLRLQPRQRRILTISLVMREAQACSVQEMSLSIETSKFVLTHCFEDSAISQSPHWYVENDAGINGALLQHVETRSINILPKPPKMQVVLHGLQKDYYTDDVVHLGVALHNGEAEAVHATAAPKIIGSSGATVDVRWASGEDNSVRTIDSMQAAATDRAELIIRAPGEAAVYTLTLDLRYTLASDPSTPLSRTISVEMAFVMPFEAKFTLAPQLHPDAWPSYFECRTEKTAAADGILQSWKVNSQLTSLISKPLKIIRLELLERDAQEDMVCTISDSVVSQPGALAANTTQTTSFGLVTQKHSLDDRYPSHLELSLVVSWSQAEDDSTEEAITTITVPPFTIPTSEPRVLCTRGIPVDEDCIAVEYHLENPSAHFLTFALTLEASEQFAFSGPKYRTLSLAPLSRHCVSYQLIVPDAMVDWISPSLQVIDSYYQKTLRVHPGGRGVRVNERREISIWAGKEDAIPS